VCAGRIQVLLYANMAGGLLNMQRVKCEFH